MEHNGVIYADNDLNFSHALRRMTGLRFPSEEGKDQLYRSYQNVYLQSHRTLLLQLAEDYASTLSQFTNIQQEAVEHHADPHPKRTLRVDAFTHLVETGALLDEYWFDPWSSTIPLVLYKAKKDEIAKNGKYMRAIADLGVHASLQGFRLTSYMKEAQETAPLEINGGTLRFIKKPEPTVLEDVFNKLISPPGRFYFVYFSDDSCFSVRRNGKVYTYNVDISSCDASHGPGIFDAFITLCGNLGEHAEILVEQCRKAIRVVSKNNPKNFTIIKFDEPRLFSGSTLTTVLNNIASLLIGVALSEAIFDGTVKSLIDSVTRTGYVVTCERCRIPERIQFLKHSPVLDVSGVYRPFLNPGVLLRLSGSCRGDLPGKGDTTIRAKKYQYSLLRSAYPTTDFPLLRNMMSMAQCHDDYSLSHLFERKVIAGKEVHSFKAEDVYRRYALDSKQIHQVDVMFGLSGVHSYSSNPGLAAILLLDYGLSCVLTHQPREQDRL